MEGGRKEGREGWREEDWRLEGEEGGIEGETRRKKDIFLFYLYIIFFK